MTLVHQYLRRLAHPWLAGKQQRERWWRIIAMIIVTLVAVGTVRFFAKSNEYRFVRIELTGREWWYGAIDPPPWLVSEIHIGDKELDPSGAVSAEVISFDSYPQGDEKFKFYPTVKLRGSFDHRSQQFIYKGSPVEVGAKIAIDLSGKKLLGIVTHVAEKPLVFPEQTLWIKAIWRNKDPWIVAAIKPGLQAFNTGTGEAIASILSVTTQLPSTDILSYVRGGSVYFNKDPKKRDVILNLKIKAQNIGGVWSYAGHQKVKLGESLWIYTDVVDIEGLEIMALSSSPHEQ